MQIKRGQQNAVELGQPAVAGQMNKDIFNIGGQQAIGRQVAPVGVQARSARVVVSGRQMSVALELASFPAGDQHHLGMGLQPDHAIQHLCADGLQHLGPVDVGLFIKACLQLHHHGHFLAAAHGLAQQAHQLGVASGAVDGLLDGKHIRVIDRLSQEGQHAAETLKGLMNQDVTLFELLKQGHAGRHLRWVTRFEIRKTQGRGIHQIHELGQPDQIHGTRNAVERQLRQIELFEQKRRQIFGTPGRNLQPDRLTKMAVLQTLAQGGAQVLDVILVHRQIGVAGHPKLRKLTHVAPRKQLRQMRPNDARQRNKNMGPASHLLRQTDHARQDTRHLDNRNLVFPSKCITPTEAHDEVEGLVGYLRERVRRVQPHGYQQRPDLPRKVLFDPAPLRRVAIPVGDDFDTAFFQRRDQVIVVQGVLAGDQSVRRLRQPGERSHREQAFGVFALVGRQVRLSPDLKKLVQIG